MPRRIAISQDLVNFQRLATSLLEGNPHQTNNFVDAPFVVSHLRFRIARREHLGGNVFIFYGASLLFASPTALFATTVHLPFVDLFIRREERQLEKVFGTRWQEYKGRVRRWL